jgi:sterol desaturase/sphingolipid hydroxylase (fatty acid hydroxylase superfamily)
MILVPQHQLGLVMLVNGQTCDDVHDIAVDIVNLESGTALRFPDAPWWASWKAVDRLATGALGISFLFLAGLAVFLYRQVRNRRYEPAVSVNPVKRTMLKIWQIALPSAPLAIIAAALITIFVLVQVYLGFNVFKVIIRFGEYAPPGAEISAATLFSVLCLWALALTGNTIFRVGYRK